MAAKPPELRPPLEFDTNSGPILLFDGVCGFCNHVVQFIVRHDRKKTLRFAALQSRLGQAVCNRHPVLAHVDSVVMFHPATAKTPERIAFRSDATLEIAAYLGGVWQVLVIGRWVPRFIRDRLYDLVARFRYRFFGKLDACLLPAPEMRARFIEDE
ncbi:MAG: DCC1-like thiol-disulfide oxidoreductase family protein [Blastocatellia bacterium]|nr:DCC1-like thiol-disulfide oxidoreductase family protein [Blastocatellia bacterium]